MRRITPLGLAVPLALGVFVVACCGAAFGQTAFAATVFAQDSEEKLPPGQERVVIPVSGMTCGGCETAIKIALKRVHGVVAAEADHEKGTATVIYEKDKITVEKLVEAINNTGFKASLPGKNSTLAPPAAAAVGVVSLADSLQPLQDRFDEVRDRPHFVALLSPT